MTDLRKQYDDGYMSMPSNDQAPSRPVETQVRLSPQRWWDNLIQRLEAVQCMLAGQICTGEELQCAYEELDDIVKIVREGLKAT